jgi:hypothetical protein
VVLAQVSSSTLPDGNIEVIIIKLVSPGEYVRIRIVKDAAGKVLSTESSGKDDVVVIDEISDSDIEEGDDVAGDTDVQGPDGAEIPVNPANVI